MKTDDDTVLTTEDQRPRRSRTRRALRIAVVAVVAAAVPLLLANPAGAYSPDVGVYDNGWGCTAFRSASGGSGRITFLFPQMVQRGYGKNEGVWVRPIVMKQVNGQWQYYADVTAVGLTGRYGMLSTSVFGTWMKLNSSITLNEYRVDVSPGTYAVLVQYRWESTGWGSYASIRSDGSNAGTCYIPK